MAIFYTAKCPTSNDNLPCIEILRERRTAIEKEITGLGGKLASIRRKDYDSESGDFGAAREQTEALLRLKFAELKNVNLRKEAFEKGTVSETCPVCKKEIPEKELEKIPLERCVLHVKGWRIIEGNRISLLLKS